ncbi:MAG: DNA translocase FtsK [Planctomycetota bacterium]|nr:DNA translocase FtsK [Planctomycetota bacterium]
MHRHAQLALAVILALAGFTVLVALASYHAGQIGGSLPAETHPFGPAGAWLAHILIRGYGLAAFLLPLVIIGWAAALWRERDVSNPSRRIAGAILLLPAVAGLLHLLPRGLGDWLLVRWDQVPLDGLGGAVGFWLCARPDHWATHGDGGILRAWLDAGGAAFALAVVALLALWLMDLGILARLRRLWGWLRHRPPSAAAESAPSGLFVSPDPEVSASRRARATTSFRELQARLSRKETLPGPEDAAAILAEIRRQREELERALAAQAAASAPAAAAPAPPAPAPAAPPVAPAPAPPAPAAAAGASGYALPPLSLLHAAANPAQANAEAEKQQTARAIEAAFRAFAVEVSVVGAQRGPTVTQYELKLLDEAMRVNKVEGFEQDLALKLGCEGIRIVAPLPNKTTIGVEVPNRVREPVTMRELVGEVDPQALAIPLIIGRDAVGRPLILDLTRAPHLLVAGATGMGKSVCMNAMICSVLLFRRPDEVRFIMVDPKMVELSGYEDIPHLLTPPITDMSKAHAALEWACQEMDQRYEALRLSGCRSIADFNALGEAELDARLARKNARREDLGCGTRMPYIVILVDEYADLMMVNKEVEKSIVRLAAKSRACGIHIILTTQRPSADVVTGLIKSNLPTRICFRVVDRSNSRVVLDVSGAENLLGRGDFLLLQPGSSAPVRGQGVYLADAEIEAIVQHARAQGAPQYDESIARAGAAALAAGGAAGGERRSAAWKTDRKLHEAVWAMYKYDKTGADFFRRKLGVGYNKATEFVETLEELGFLSPANGTAPRKILKTWDEWIDLLRANGVELSEDVEYYRSPFAD